MMKPTIVVGAAILLTLGLQVTATASNGFDLEKAIEAYVQRVAQQNEVKVLRWDITGALDIPAGFADEILGVSFFFPSYEKNAGQSSKLNIKAGAIKYGKVSTTRNISTLLHREMVSAWPERLVTTLEKSIVHTRKSSWHSQISTSHGCKFSVTAGLPSGWSANAEYHREMTLVNGTAGEYTESETLKVNQQIPIPPMTPATIEWFAIDQVEEIPWTADVTAEGYFGVVFDKTIDGYNTHIERITELQDPLVTKINDHTIRYPTTGVFLGVKTIGNKLKITKMDPESYSRRAASIIVIDLPLH